MSIGTRFQARRTMHRLLSENIHAHYGRLCHTNDPQEALDELNRFRILCAVNQGSLGVDTLNAKAAAVLAVARKNPGSGRT